MQFIKISPSTTLSELSEQVGAKNIDAILHLNGLPRRPDIGKVFKEKCNQIQSEVADIAWQRKCTVLNSLTKDSDVFEYASLLSGSGWKVLSSIDTFPNMLRIPDTISLPDSSQILGNGEQTKTLVYREVMRSFQEPPHFPDMAVFSEYSSIRPSSVVEPAGGIDSKVFQWFKIPWGEVTLYSSLSGDTIDFPVYPESMSDGVRAEYTTMPDLIYQYEPWQLYTRSGPRTNTYEFDFHRDMWTGDHRDGKANELIRFCMANCYPRYNGSAVHTATVVLYVHGKNLITGILTDVSVDWDGPIGLDGFYLHCKMTLTITEVSPQPINYDSMRRKPLIG